MTFISPSPRQWAFALLFNNDNNDREREKKVKWLDRIVQSVLFLTAAATRLTHSLTPISAETSPSEGAAAAAAKLQSFFFFFSSFSPDARIHSALPSWIKFSVVVVVVVIGCSSPR